MNRDIAAAYLRGLFDGEGSVRLVGHRTRTIRIANTETSILDHAMACLDTLTITARLTWSNPNSRHPT
jgi:LAGLIDADG-like domain